MISFARLDRRVIYVLVGIALGLPLYFNYSVPPAQMRSADKLYEVIEGLEIDDNDVAFVALDFGPTTKAENEPQSAVIIEHLMRKRIPLVTFSISPLAVPFLRSIPEGIARRLNKENPGETWTYGKDWVNIGFRPGAGLLIQSIPKSENLAELFKKDARGNNLADLPRFKNWRTLEDIKFLAEFTGSVGAFDNYVQFFQSKTHKPLFGHGCTSITIPEAYIYLDSGQLDGLLEGIAGAAWYSELLQKSFTDRVPDASSVMNTGLGIAHLVIIFLVVLGNVAGIFEKISG